MVAINVTILSAGYTCYKLSRFPIIAASSAGLANCSRDQIRCINYILSNNLNAASLKCREVYFMNARLVGRGRNEVYGNADVVPEIAD